MSDFDPTWGGEWVADAGHSTIGFTARHAMVAKVGGAFDDIEVTIHAEVDQPEQSSIVVRIGAASINTRNAQRDEHLRGPDFLDVERFPHITFVSTSIEEVDDMAFMVTGDLTIRDVTKSFVVPVDFVGVAKDPFGNVRAGFEGRRRMNRRDFGLEWNMPLDTGGVLVSEKIEMFFEISAVRPTTSPGQDQ